MRLTALCALFAGALAAQQLDERIKAEAEAIGARLIETRRDLAKHPELSNREEWTGKYIADRLRQIGYSDLRTNVARHGVVAVLKGGRPGPVVAWRADMDGLPVQDIGDKPYKSQIAGVKHACGHDSHVAIALGVAEVLYKVRAEVSGTIKFIFQPAEEGAPIGEDGGAALMIKEGVLENPKPEAIFGLHIWSQAASGTAGYTPGAAMASSDSFQAIITGKRVHAASPHLGIDPIVVAAQCISALQTIRSRRVDPLEPIVITIGQIHGGNRSNIIPESVSMEGTLRTLDEQTRESVRTMMKQTLAGCTAESGASFELKWEGTQYPVTLNNPDLTRKNLAALERVFGKDRVKLIRPTLGAEDFSFYGRAIPGFFWFLGTFNQAKGVVGAHHTAEFDIDEDVLLPGLRAAAGQLTDYLARQAK